MPAPYNHPSGVADAYDRTPDHPDWTDIVFREGRFAQAAELNELASMLGGRGRRVGNLVARDGDRVEGADIIVNTTTGVVTLAAGKIYVKGDVRAVTAATMTGVPMTGEVTIGVRIVRQVITEVENAALYGLFPGSEGEGEAGAARVVETVAWGRVGDGEEGDLYSVYLLRDGTVIDQTPPPSLSGVNQAIAIYDREAHGNYVVRGCRVTALGKTGSDWHYSIGEGVANIRGYKRTRDSSLRHIEPEAYDVQRVTLEPHTFADGGSGSVVVPFNKWPLDTLISAIITKQKTVSLTKGVTNSSDALPDGSVTAIVSVTAGATTYVQGVDYQLTADSVNWSLGGAEPTSGTSYNVTYQYLSAVTPDSVTAKDVTLSGGVTGTNLFLTYDWKLPRTDLLCMDEAGLSVYIKGVSAPKNPAAPIAPSTLLSLAKITHNWLDLPVVENTDIRSVTFEELWIYLRRLWTMLDLVALERLKSSIDFREPVAKKGVFVDPFTDDTYRDAGELPQSMAVYGGHGRLAIDPTIYNVNLTAPLMLDYTHEIVIRQELATRCHVVNPYQNFEPLPGELQLTPSSDFWVVRNTNWLSPITQEFEGSVDRTETETNLVGETSENIPFLRTISVDFTIRGFASGEVLQSLTFDSISVKPPGTQTANSSGVISGTFNIPANVTAGTKEVVAVGMAGTRARANFVGQGRIDTQTLQRVTTIWRAPEPPDTAIDWNDFDNDPLAQTWRTPESRFITGVNVKFCAKGDPANACILQLRTVENGMPTSTILGECFIDMNTVVVGSWFTANLRLPIFNDPTREVAWVMLTDDPDHALSIAGIGDFDATLQRYVGAQPYSVGVMLSSSNARTWTAHQNEDWTMQIRAALFGPTSKTHTLGTFAVVDMSDVIIRAGVELPTADCSVVFELERASGAKIYLLPNQPYEFTEYITETVTLRAILTGTSKVSPVLYAAQMIAGKLRTTGVYVSRAFTMGAAIRMSAFLKSYLPAGSSYTVEIDKADDVWSTVAVFGTETLDLGWTEKEHRVTPYTATVGRLRLTLTGSPAARPLLADFRAVSI